MVGEDLDTSYDQTYKHEFSFKCRGCGNFHAYNFEDVKYECIKNESGIYKWESLSAWYECPGCGERYEDTVSDRRAMSDSAEYIPAHSENPVKGHIGFHFSALNVWWISWEVLVQEFLKAKDLAKNGNFNALRQSCDLAKETGLTYEHYEGSPISQGIFQWEMWGLTEDGLSGMYDWDELRADILLYGLRNSLLTTCPPTASSARVIGSNEAFEPFTSNLYVRKVTGGEFAMVNKHLVRDLED